MARKADGRRLRGRLLKEARKLGFLLKRRGSFSVKFLQDEIDRLKKQKDEMKILIERRDRLKSLGARRSTIQMVINRIKELEITPKSRGTPERQVRHQKERRNR